MAKNIDFMGAIFPDVPSVKLPQQGGGLVAFDDTTDATATADKILQGYTAYANGQKLTGTASGGITPSGTYSITSNGTYDVTQYASADVNVSGGGGGDHDGEDGIVARTATAYSNSRVSAIGSYAFASYGKLQSVSFANATEIGSSAFLNCSSLTTANFPNVTTVYDTAFSGCRYLQSLTMPKVENIKTYAFSTCRSLTKIECPNLSSRGLGAGAFHYCINISEASFPTLTSIAASTFTYCSSLMALYLLASSVCTLKNTIVFGSTPMSNSTYTGSFGSIYVPASLVSAYKSAANWSVYKDRITSYVE